MLLLYRSLSAISFVFPAISFIFFAVANFLFLRYDKGENNCLHQKGDPNEIL